MKLNGDTATKTVNLLVIDDEEQWSNECYDDVL